MKKGILIKTTFKSPYINDYVILSEQKTITFCKRLKKNLNKICWVEIEFEVVVNGI